MKNYLKKAVLPLSLCGVALSATAQEKPNVLFIFADDLTINGLGSLSNGEVSTPNLDRLRTSGAFFSHAFNQGGWGGAISVASRSMLATGRYLWKARDFEKQGARESNLEGTNYWSQYMKQAGYTTYITGKWHVASVDPSKIFDYSNNIRPGMPNDTPQGYAKSERHPNGRLFQPGEQDSWSPSDPKFEGYWKGGKHWAQVTADDAVEYLGQAKSKDDPFFMYVAFNAPHDPRQAPQEFQDKYNVNDIKIPENFVPEYQYKDAIGCDETLRDEWLAPFPRTEYSIQVNRKEYYALISYLDYQVGRVLDALESSGKMDNTYIIFTADHGLSVGDHGFLGKQNMYDASMRTPLIVAGPGISPKEVDGMVYLQDAMATSLDIAGATPGECVDFKSLLPLATGTKGDEAVQDAVYGSYMDLQRMIRTDKYKMLFYPAANVLRLYDVAQDPQELKDLASNPKYKKVMAKLFKQFMELQQEVGDPLDVTECYQTFVSKL